MPTSTRVMIPTEEGWSRVGSAAVEVDRRSGSAMLCVRLDAMAPRVYIPLEDVLLLQGGCVLLHEGPPIDQPVGHARAHRAGARIVPFPTAPEETEQC